MEFHMSSMLFWVKFVYIYFKMVWYLYFEWQWIIVYLPASLDERALDENGCSSYYSSQKLKKPGEFLVIVELKPYTASWSEHYRSSTQWLFPRFMLQLWWMSSSRHLFSISYVSNSWETEDLSLFKCGVKTILPYLRSLFKTRKNVRHWFQRFKKL